MKLTILVDNGTIIDRYYLAEPAVSYYIETEEVKVLFDVGYSDAFLENAKKLKIDPLDAEYLVLSHGHIDHTGGLDILLKEAVEAKLERGRSVFPSMVAHPNTFLPKYMDDGTSIGIAVHEEVLNRQFGIRKSREPVWLSEKLVFLGEIERVTTFEQPGPIGFSTDPASGTQVPDQLLDDTAMAYIGENGLIIITGCSHSGICNIVDAARKVTGVEKVADIIGGFHLLKPDPVQLQGTVDFFDELGLEKLHACHCTDFQSRLALSSTAEMEEIGSGMQLEYK